MMQIRYYRDNKQQTRVMRKITWERAQMPIAVTAGLFSFFLVMWIAKGDMHWVFGAAMGICMLSYQVSRIFVAPKFFTQNPDGDVSIDFDDNGICVSDSQSKLEINWEAITRFEEHNGFYHFGTKRIALYDVIVPKDKVPGGILHYTKEKIRKAQERLEEEKKAEEKAKEESDTAES